MEFRTGILPVRSVEAGVVTTLLTTSYLWDSHPLQRELRRARLPLAWHRTSSAEHAW
jgi:hypothetical protein